MNASKKRAEEIDFFMSIKLPPDQICAALKTTPETLARWCWRNGYKDLAGRLEPLVAREKAYKERERKKTNYV